MIYILITLSVLIVFICIIHILYVYKKTKDILHFSNFFTLIFLINYPIMMLVNISGIYVLNSNKFGFFNQISALIIIFLGWFFFNLPVYFTKKKRIKKKKIDSFILKYNAYFYLCIIILILISVHGKNLLCIFDVTRLFEIRKERLIEQSGSAFKALSMTLLNINVIIFSLKALVQKRIKLFFFFFVVFGYLNIVLTTSKTAAMTPLLIFFFVYHYFFKSLSLYKSSLFFIVGFFSLIFLSGARGLKIRYLSILASLKQVANAFDGMENFVAIFSRVEKPIFGQDFFSHYIEYLIYAPIPRVLWLNKPEIYGNLSIQREYIPELFFGKNGMTVSPSFVGPMFIDAGIFGVVITSFLSGVFFLTAYNCFIKSNKFSCLFVYLFLFLNIISFLRVGIGIFSSFLVYCFLYIIFIISLQVIYKNSVFKG